MSFRWLLLGLLLVSHGFADQQADRIAAIHVAAIGGDEALKALTSLRATGDIQIAGQTIAMTMVAQAPNHVWVETRTPGLISTQGYNGKDAPWQCVDHAQTKTVSTMDSLAANEFIADADFYDPLYEAAQRGYTLKAMESLTVGGKTYLRIHVSNANSTPFELWLDPDTYLIVRQVRMRLLPDGREVPIETRFSDFRPVGGVLMAFTISTYADHRKLHETDLASIAPNPPIEPGLFDIPSQPANQDKNSNPFALH
ncbi:hypothetical protein GALL_257680 [mine drainage metagenome]|uniref:Outer membrane lipoprotein-sorting protein n=1 Tax=mine drainage metagenome TaxID=410659 RepID=A0A1J5RW31_9ZZZZ